MEFTGQKKVHIVPMGFEIDRIEMPLRDIGADRVYLITDLYGKKKRRATLYISTSAAIGVQPIDVPQVLRELKPAKVVSLET